MHNSRSVKHTTGHLGLYLRMAAFDDIETSENLVNRGHRQALSLVGLVQKDRLW